MPITTKDGVGGRIRVVVAAISAVRREGLKAIVRSDSSLLLSGSATGLLGLETKVRDLQPDVVVADLSHPDPQFPLVAASLETANISAVALIDEPTPGWTSRALRSGARGILPRDSPASEILLAIRAAKNGLVLLDPEIVKELSRNPPREIDETAPGNVEELTPREIEVLRLLADGLGNKEVGLRLGISDHTAKFHISSILAKLGAGSRTEAVTLGIRKGLILL
jgi:two-component system, NarL family, response regulator YdfI